MPTADSARTKSARVQGAAPGSGRGPPPRVEDTQTSPVPRPDGAALLLRKDIQNAPPERKPMPAPKHELGQEFQVIPDGPRVRRGEIRILDLDVAEPGVAQDHPERRVAGNPEVEVLFKKRQRPEAAVVDRAGIRGGQEEPAAGLQGAVRGIEVFERARQVLNRAPEDDQVEEVGLGEEVPVEGDSRRLRALPGERRNLHAPGAGQVPADRFQKLARRAAHVEDAALQEDRGIQPRLQEPLLLLEGLEAERVVLLPRAEVLRTVFLGGFQRGARRRPHHSSASSSLRKTFRPPERRYAPAYGGNVLARRMSMSSPAR